MKSYLAMPRVRAAAVAFVAALVAAGCGGGGGNPGACLSGSPQTCSAAVDPPAPAPAPSASSQLAEICTLDGIKRFTRAYLDETYLWYREIPSIDPAPYTNIGRYFFDLLTPALDSSGQRKDRFSFLALSADADSLLTGTITAYGVRWELDAQGRQRAAFIDEGSPAQAAGLARGAELVQVLTPGTPDWYPNAGSTISFTYRPAPGQPLLTATLNSAVVQENPVPLVRTVASPNGRRVAYLLFNAHTEGAQDKLIAAMTTLQQAGVNELVLDMRYNGGGFLVTALTLASMVTGPGVDGQVFERLQFNDKRQADTEESVYEFAGKVQFGDTDFPTGAPLPRLSLPRLYVLTSAGTCSASESVINSLRGVGVDVVLVGDTTCGKPYGFSRRENCGLAYFPIEFQGTNAQGFGDYASGFAPTCAAPDDFDHALGATDERLLATALSHIDQGSCPPQVALRKALPAQSAVPGTSHLLPGKVVVPRK
jgi:carboxyl-terminal processing protease